MKESYREWVGEQAIEISFDTEDADDESISVLIDGKWHDITKLLKKAPTNPAYSMIEWVVEYFTEKILSNNKEIHHENNTNIQ